MRYVGIDYGARRIGVAQSDAEGKMAFPLRTIEYRAREYVMAEIKKICDGPVAAIVVGLPIGLDGQETDETREVRRFAEDLARAMNMPIYPALSEISATNRGDTGLGAESRSQIGASGGKGGVYFENEMLTSRMAYGAGMRGNAIDASSAAIILQSYLDKSVGV